MISLITAYADTTKNRNLIATKAFQLLIDSSCLEPRFLKLTRKDLSLLLNGMKIIRSLQKKWVVYCPKFPGERSSCETMRWILQRKVRCWDESVCHYRIDTLIRSYAHRTPDYNKENGGHPHWTSLCSGCCNIQLLESWIEEVGGRGSRSTVGTTKRRETDSFVSTGWTVNARGDTRMLQQGFRHLQPFLPEYNRKYDLFMWLVHLCFYQRLLM